MTARLLICLEYAGGDRGTVAVATLAPGEVVVVWGGSASPPAGIAAKIGHRWAALEPIVDARAVKPSGSRRAREPNRV